MNDIPIKKHFDRNYMIMITNSEKIPEPETCMIQVSLKFQNEPKLRSIIRSYNSSADQFTNQCKINQMALDIKLVDDM